MTRAWTWLLVFVSGGLVACARQAPEERDAIRFVHGPHLLTGASCASCHKGAARADPQNDGSEPMYPTEEQCKGCHNEGAQARCEFCHTAPQVAAGYRRLENDIRFVHGSHAEPRQGGCIHCHGIGMSDSSVASFAPTIPPMDACTGCHAEDMRELNCSRCHDGLQRYSVEALAFIRHAPGFVRTHGVRARADQQLCTQCHDDGFCMDCHESTRTATLEVLRPVRVVHDMVHPGSWLPRHPTEARLDQGSCLRCHGVSFCDGCHRESGIGGSVGQGSRHPVGWLNPMSPDFHGREARRDITRCVACHESDAETTCVPCHRVGGLAPNPHPSGFGTESDARNRAVCRTCHGSLP